MMHFTSLRLSGTGPIAIYLFLLGISAGATTLSVLLRRQGAGSESGIIKATAILAPVSVVLGLLILIFHLARPWTFWKLMFHYQFDSVMSMGVMLFQVYMAVLFAWLAVVFRAEIAVLRRQLLVDKFAFVDGLIGWLARLERLLAPLLLLLAVLLGAYTGFLLSALKTYPMLNNPILPALHGGVIAGFMEHAAMLHLLMFMGIPHLPKIIDFSIDYLRAGHYRDTYVQCQVWRQGRRVANVAMTAWQTSQSEPIATARAHFKVDEP